MARRRTASKTVLTAVTPLKIDNLTLCAFRAFPHKINLHFGGKNLLVHGENGSGKSSIYQALEHFFSLRPKQASELKNVHNENAESQFLVGVGFNDNSPVVEWTYNRHPTSLFRGATDTRVSRAALRRSMMDYRALLDTNYKHDDKRPNLFPIIVDHVLADFPVTTEGGTTKTLGVLWRELKNAEPRSYYNSVDTVNQACAAFNEGLRQALEQLAPHLQNLLKKLVGDSISVEPFRFSGVSYYMHWYHYQRGFLGMSLIPEICIGTHSVEVPQTFLNEARLSAIAIAMYLAGRKACVPEGHDGELRLLALDDVLIGLDHENRQPLLQVLLEDFADWQIVVLTHDRVWFEMARAFFELEESWEWAEIRTDGNDGRDTPTVRQHNSRIAQEALDEAKALLNDYPRSSANSVRRAAEATIRRFAEKKNVEVRFKSDPKSIDMADLIKGIYEWSKKDPNQRKKYKLAAMTLKSWFKGVLHPQSHAGAPSYSTREISKAIKAVEELYSAIR